MRVLAVSTWCPVPPDNGSRLRAFHLLGALTQRHDVTLVTFTDGNLPGATLDGLRALASHVETVAASPFVQGPLTVRGLLSSTPRSLIQAHHSGMQERVDRLATQCDVALGLQLSAAVYLRGLTIPKVFEEAEAGTLRDQPADARGLERVRRSLMWRKSARFMRRLIGQFERTTVVSARERSLLVDLGVDPARVVVIPNGVDDRDLVRSRPPRTRRIIYPGALTYAANLDAVRAFLETTWPRLRSIPALEFVVTGSLDGVDLSTLPPHDDVRFTGRVNDVKALIAESAAVVVPLRTGGGTRLKILEAMALGTPVISTAKGAEGLDVTDGEHLLLAHAPDDWVRQLTALLDTPALDERLSRAGRAFVARHHRWTVNGEALNQTLEEARAERGRTS